jgi:hypothetical protein
MPNVMLFFSNCAKQGIADKLVLLDLSEGTKGGTMDLDIFNLPNVEISKGLVILPKAFIFLGLIVNPRFFFFFFFWCARD